MKKTKGKLDPLEENKVEAKTGGKKRSSTKKTSTERTYSPPTDPPPDPPGRDEPAGAIPEADPLPPAPGPARAKPEKKPVPMVPEKPAPPSDLPLSASGKYEVLEGKTVSIRGHITSMPAGTVIHLAHYGRQVMVNMIKQGLKLKGVD
jgi:hypothetical protein